MTTVAPPPEPISSERPGPRLQRAWRGASGALVLGAVLTAAPVSAQTSPPAPPAASESEQRPAEVAKGPNTGRLSLSGGVDWTSAYFFRGIKQETEGLILQPYGELSIKLVDDAGALTSLSLTPGIWNSLQTGPTGSDSPTASDPKVWYEFDGYARLSAVLWEELTTYALCTAYVNPNNAFGTVQELAFGIGYNDAKLLGPFALNPSFLVAFELDGQADAGTDKGIYAQIGIAPGYTFLPESRYPLTVTVPVSVGLSLKDYYEFGTGSDDTFGYFSGGVNVSIPLHSSRPTSASGSSRLASPSCIQLIGTVGLAFTY